MTTNRNPEASNTQLLILLAIFGSIFALIIWGLLFLFDVAIAYIPYSVEQQLGALIVPIYEKQAEKSPIQDTLNQLLDTLETHLEKSQEIKRDYQVIYIPEKTVNAVAIPGDRIIIFQGLLEAVESENELMMILGHELGHFAHRDHLRSLGRSLALKIALASILGDGGAIANSAGMAIETIAKSSYSQNQEIQADEFGLNLLYQTYNHVAGATDFFARLSQKDHAKWDFLASHPAPVKRVQNLKKIIQENKYSLGKLSPLPSTLKSRAFSFSH